MSDWAIDVFAVVVVLLLLFPWVGTTVIIPPSTSVVPVPLVGPAEENAPLTPGGRVHARRNLIGAFRIPQNAISTLQTVHRVIPKNYNAKRVFQFLC